MPKAPRTESHHFPNRDTNVHTDSDAAACVEMSGKSCSVYMMRQCLCGISSSEVNPWPTLDGVLVGQDDENKWPRTNGLQRTCSSSRIVLSQPTKHSDWSHDCCE